MTPTHFLSDNALTWWSVTGQLLATLSRLLLVAKRIQDLLRVSIEVVACLEALQSCPVKYHQIIGCSRKLKYHQIKMSSFELLLDESLKHAFVSNILKSITRYPQGVQKNVLIEQNLGLGLGGAWSCLVLVRNDQKINFLTHGVPATGDRSSAPQL